MKGRPAILVALALTWGCGGGGRAPAKSAPPGAVEQRGVVPAAEPADEGGDAAPEAEEDADAAGDGFAQPPTTTMPAPRPGPGGGGADPLAVAETELASAAAELLEAGGDCARACRALDSMKRARDRICAMTAPADSEGRCARARRRVRESSERVDRTCGPCAG